MSDEKEQINDLYVGLMSLIEGSFPKKCNNCNNVYKNVKEFLSQTESLQRYSGLKESSDDSKKILLLFRNCKCGSTLMECFQDRRDASGRGSLLREKFIQLLDELVTSGVELEVAEQVLKEKIRGKK